MDRAIDILRQFEQCKIEQKNYRSYILYNYATAFAALAHFFFIFIFAMIKVKDMVILNIFSVIVYVIANILNERGYQKGLFLVSVVEVILHASLAVYFIGWDSGFQYFLVLLIPIILFTPLKKSIYKLFLIIFSYLSFTSIYLFGHYYAPLVSVGSPAIDVIYNINIFFITIVLSLMFYSYKKAVLEVESKLSKINEKLNIMAATDPLTKILNRRAMLEKIELMKDEIVLNSRSFCLVLCDIDDFKSFNDTYGHECGDFIIKSIAETLQSELRERDFVSRWGGEEFLILLNELEMENAKLVVDRMRLKISNSSFFHNEKEIKVTLTFGISECNYDSDLYECINTADKALYKGKNKGKNRIECGFSSVVIES